jgi:hypothetical protein
VGNDMSMRFPDSGRVAQWHFRMLFAFIFLIASLWAPPATFARLSLNSPTGQEQVQPENQIGTDKKITISTSHDWTDTGIELAPGDVLRIAVDGGALSDSQHRCSAGPGTVSPDRLRINSAAPGALLARLAANAQPFPVVYSRNVSITDAGHLYLAPNDLDSCEPGIVVSVHVGPATATIIKDKLSNAAQIWLAGQFGANAAAPSSNNGDAPAHSPAGPASKATATPNVPSPPLDSAFRQQFDQLPRRVVDQFNNPGDMVNFVIIGAEQQVQNALAAAHWYLADTSNSDAITKAIEMTRQNKDYVQMPMSPLYLFGRVQDFGYEQAEPYAVVASRHHFRLWKAPFLFNGQPVWVGAGTHDIGFEKDQRNGSITHKIDPEVDQERQNIGESLQKTGLVASLNNYLPPNPVQSAKNATGGLYHSDGRILVITLKSNN